jgi:hypothetical protein
MHIRYAIFETGKAKVEIFHPVTMPKNGLALLFSFHLGLESKPLED